MNIFKLPDLGEGLPDAEIVKWYVKIGDEVNIDDPLVAMETAKAIVDVPSPSAGKIIKLYGGPGDVIDTGASLVEFSRKDTGTVAGKIEEGNTILEEESAVVTDKTNKKNTSKSGIKAIPAIRALAKRLNLNLEDVIPTGLNNTITKQDVEKAANNSNNINFEPLHGVRKIMADTVSKSHREVVAVSVYEDAILLDWSLDADITIRVFQAIVAACKQEPALNAHYNGEKTARKLLFSVDLGVAMDVEDGLFVPVLKDIANKSASKLREELDNLKLSVQSRTVSPDSLHGHSIVLSNFGKFSGRYATPIVVPPAVAILGVGSLREEVVAVDGEPSVQKVLPLSLTFDHRACTGGEATRFLAAVIKALKRLS